MINKTLITPIPDICHLHHLHVGGEKICHVEKFQNSIKNLWRNVEKFQNSIKNLKSAYVEKK